VPAAAVIPAPIAYINVAAVKKLVVEILAFQTRPYLFQRVWLDRLWVIILVALAAIDLVG